MTTRKNIENVLWKACDSFRGKIDSSRYKDYILSMLFVKYLSDLNKERRAWYTDHFAGDRQRIDRAMSREPFVIDDKSSFDYLYENRSNTQIGQKINIALSAIEECNGSKLPTYSEQLILTPLSILASRAKKTLYSKTCLRIFTNLTYRPRNLTVLILSAMLMNT
jgi:type I restriction enzyme M protein